MGPCTPCVSQAHKRCGSYNEEMPQKVDRSTSIQQTTAVAAQKPVSNIAGLATPFESDGINNATSNREADIILTLGSEAPGPVVTHVDGPDVRAGFSPGREWP